jgi:hypothetical protein
MDSKDSGKASKPEPARKPYKKRTKAEKERDAEYFMDRHLEKYSYYQIADLWMALHPGYTISHTTVKDAVHAQVKTWKQANQATVNRAIMKGQLVIDLIQNKAFAGYDRSCEAAQRITTTRSLPSLKGGAQVGEDDDDDYAEDERKLQRLMLLIDKLCDENGLPPITRQVESVEGQSGNPGFLRVAAFCEQIRLKQFEALSLMPTVNPALLAIAKAMGVEVEPESEPD